MGFFIHIVYFEYLSLKNIPFVAYLVLLGTMANSVGARMLRTESPIAGIIQVNHCVGR